MEAVFVYAFYLLKPFGLLRGLAWSHFSTSSYPRCEVAGNLVESKLRVASQGSHTFVKIKPFIINLSRWYQSFNPDLDDVAIKGVRFPLHLEL
ncbi:hypothetical protein Ancab_038420 [Ancistrocladus abbreviatus]